jgi:hypothetical protein
MFAATRQSLQRRLTLATRHVISTALPKQSAALEHSFQKASLNDSGAYSTIVIFLSTSTCFALGMSVNALSNYTDLRYTNQTEHLERQFGVLALNTVAP